MMPASFPQLPLPLEIINAKIPGYPELQNILISQQGKITQITPMSQIGEILPDSQRKILDVQGDWLSLGGVDLQINGALGLAFPDLTNSQADLQKLLEICHFLWLQGIDAFVPTIVTTSVAKIQRSLAAFREFLQVYQTELESGRYAEILGIHLEGPFLNPAKKGAHPAEYLLPLTIEQVKTVLGNDHHLVKIITLAPELDTTDQVIPYLKELGMIVSLGHSQATAEQAERAFQQGATMVTHAFNAMPPLHHREAGLLGAAIINESVQCGLIADGQHVCPIMINILLKASQYQKGIFLVSDALSPLGLPDGFYPWDSRQIEVKQGTARLPDGTLSGTTHGLLVGVENLVKWQICHPETAIILATDAPRQAIGLSTTLSKKSINQILRWQQITPTDENPVSLAWQRLVLSPAKKSVN
jgi:N-acetylglucosamine-6-phosphate deacetylase